MSEIDGKKLAGYPTRIFAAMFDICFLLAINIALSIVLRVIVTSNVILGLAYIVLMPTMIGLYFCLTMSRKSRNGQTFGKQLVGIQVVHATEPVDGGIAFLRQGVNIIGVFIIGVGMVLPGVLFAAFPNTFGIGLAAVCWSAVILNFLSPLWDKNSQAFHDKMSKTYVVAKDDRN